MSLVQSVAPLAGVEPHAWGGEPRWFAVYTIPNHERRVAAHLLMRGVESYLPLYRAKRRWKNGCTVTLELPLFPGYVFVRMAPRQRVSVLEIPSVLWILGNGREPLPLPEGEIESLRAGLGTRAAQPHPYLTHGYRARIRSGPLQGWEGVVLWTKGESGGFRVVLSLDTILKSVAVEVGAEELELLGAVAS